MQLLSGRICEPSLAASWVALWWTELSEGIPAKERASRASSAALMIPDGCGHMSPDSSESCAPSGASSRTSRTMPIRDSASSDRTWKAWVTTLRREYSQRKKSARLTDGSGCSSSRSVEVWPTATATDCKASGAAAYSTDSGRHAGTTLTDAAVRTPRWLTPHGMATMDHTGHMGAGGELDQQAKRAMEQWPTPTLPYGTNQGGAAGRVGPVRPSLEGLARQWSTPRASPNENRNTKPAPSHGNGHGRTLAGDALTWVRNADESDSAAPCSTPESISNNVPTIPGDRTSDHRGTSAQPTPDCGPFWGTPRVTTNGGSSNGQTYGKGSWLEDQAAAWATPSVAASRQSARVQPKPTKAGNQLPDQAISWATPTTRDGKDGGSPSLVTPTNSLLGHQAPRMLTAGGASLLPDEWTFYRLYLNPRFVCWLMGWPAEWTNSALEEMESWLFRQRMQLTYLLRDLACVGTPVEG
jgi:hypothetical protein